MAKRDWNYADLPVPERMQLIEDIWDSIAREPMLGHGSAPSHGGSGADSRHNALIGSAWIRLPKGTTIDSPGAPRFRRQALTAGSVGAIPVAPPPVEPARLSAVPR